jgi:pimeloyl-ACP methyl ester carboxylesterase
MEEVNAAGMYVLGQSERRIDRASAELREIGGRQDGRGSHADRRSKNRARARPSTQSSPSAQRVRASLSRAGKRSAQFMGPVPFVELPSHRVHYRELGDPTAPPVLLIMGLGLSAISWQTLPERLAERFRVISFDNRGTGRSTAPPGLFSIPDLADDARAVLDAIGVERSGVFGISLGGMIAIELALRHPRQVRSLALGATYAGWLASTKPPLGTLWHFLLGAVFESPRSAAQLPEMLVSPDYLSRAREDFWAWLDGSEPVPTSLVVRQILAAVGHSAERRLGEITVPTLVLTGDQDRLVPRDNSVHLARRIRGARLVELPAGHCFPLERTDDVVRELFLFFLEAEKSDR